MIANLPIGEKQAFFGLLDEYFASRPHRLPSSSAHQPGTAQWGARLADRATAATGDAAGAAVTGALRDQFARTGISTKGPPPPAPSTNSKPKPGTTPPAGLVTSRKIGSINLGSRSIPTSPSAQPTSTTTRTAATTGRSLPPPSRTGVAVPVSVSPPAPPALPEGVIGTAQVLYDYGDGTDADDLQAKEGEQIYLSEKISDDWWRAMSQDQSRHGIIPTTYVQQL